VNPATWSISPEGIGPYRIGDDYQPDDPVLLVEDYRCPVKEIDDEDHGVIWLWSEQEAFGKVSTVFAWGPGDGQEFTSPETEEGIKLGSTRDQFDAAYPESLPATFFPEEPEDPDAVGGNRYIMAGSVPIAFQFDFDTDSVVTAIAVGATQFSDDYCG
jgi:hypothetical protein